MCNSRSVTLRLIKIANSSKLTCPTLSHLCPQRHLFSPHPTNCEPYLCRTQAGHNTQHRANPPCRLQQVVDISRALCARTMALLTSSAGVVLLLLLAYTLHSSVCLLRNYLAARKMGVPVRIIPVDHINPMWSLASQKVVSLLRRLPFGLGDNNITKYNYLGFEIPLRWKSHYELGDAFILCSPARNWLYLGNPADITGMFKRNSDFPHDSELTAMLDVFGPNISTVSETLILQGWSSPSERDC